ncbi:MAG: hypothetical protein KBA71_07360 [Opitutaceae bacterium]|nr:hypothetical protein [Opitutaceae bacterium]
MPAVPSRHIAIVFELERVGSQVIAVPADCRFLSVAAKGQAIRLFGLCDPELPKVRREVKIISTGHRIDGNAWEFAGTAVTRGRVFHVFVEIE